MALNVTTTYHTDYSLALIIIAMEQIKKKLATLKDEKEAAIEKADEAEAQRKEAEAKAEAVYIV